MNFQDFWKPSIEHLGNCGYKGVITSKAITRVSVVDISKCLPLCSEVLEAVITLATYSVCGAQYRMLTRWFMGEPVSVEEWFTTQSVNQLDYMAENEKASDSQEVFQNARQSKTVLKSIWP